jgi:hypothetical protein
MTLLKLFVVEKGHGGSAAMPFFHIIRTTIVIPNAVRNPNVYLNNSKQSISLQLRFKD